jgi:hypothetical protein
MTDESDKLHDLIAGHAMRFVNNDGEPYEGEVLVQASETTADEIELAFTLRRDRYYLRVRKADLLRLIKDRRP